MADEAARAQAHAGTRCRCCRERAVGGADDPA